MQRRKKILEGKKILDNKLRNIYYNVKNPAAFGSIRKVAKEARKIGVKQRDTRNWLLEQATYTLHRPNRRNFKTNHYLVFGKNELFEADLIDLQGIARYNYSYKYILCVIDCFTKYVWARALTNKSAPNVTRAFQSILEESGQIPLAMNMDRGREFDAKVFQNYLKKMNIKQYFPYTQMPSKASIIERSLKTIKQRIFKYLTSRGPTYRKYVDVLQDIVRAYNNTVHSTTKMAPAKFQPKDTVRVYENIRKSVRRYDVNEVPHLHTGDFVRIIRKKSVLEHGYTELYTREIFRVSTVIRKRPIPFYKLMDLNNVPINGKFYEKQLMKVNIPADSIVRVINTRETKRNRHYEVETGDGQRVWMNETEYMDNRLN